MACQCRELLISSCSTMSVDSSLDTASTDNNDTLKAVQDHALLTICQAKNERNVSVVSNKRFIQQLTYGDCYATGSNPNYYNHSKMKALCLVSTTSAAPAPSLTMTWILEHPSQPTPDVEGGRGTPTKASWRSDWTR